MTAVEESRNVVLAALENKAEPRVTSWRSMPGPQSTWPARPQPRGGRGEGVQLIKSGAARAKLDAFVKFTQQVARG